MSDPDNKEPELSARDAHSEAEPPRFDKATVQAALKRSAAGANELHGQIKEVFALTDSSATLRLR